MQDRRHGSFSGWNVMDKDCSINMFGRIQFVFGTLSSSSMWLVPKRSECGSWGRFTNSKILKKEAACSST